MTLSLISTCNLPRSYLVVLVPWIWGEKKMIPDHFEKGT